MYIFFLLINLRSFFILKGISLLIFYVSNLNINFYFIILIYQFFFCTFTGDIPTPSKEVYTFPFGTRVDFD